jgi:probable rRNA maturation factor
MLASTIENLTPSPIDEEALLEICGHVCKRYSINQAVHIRLTGNREIQELNLHYRGLDTPTDILTFPSGLALPFPIGDLAISVDYAQAQATARGGTQHSELAALVIHGVLHLAGFDDETEDDKKVMQAEMHKVGEELAIPIEADWTSILHQEHED